LAGLAVTGGNGRLTLVLDEQRIAQRHMPPMQGSLADQDREPVSAPAAGPVSTGL
jgi:hypothetical protein